jgi:hypothetical protein
VRMRRYQVSDRIEIRAPVEQVYATAADPGLVPSYAPEVVMIERVRKISDRVELVRSHVKVGGLTFAYLYRYCYRPPTHYSGVQEGGGLLRGYFSLSFRPRGRGTQVTHAEGFLSPVPGLARALGFLYFRVLARGGVRDELESLMRLVEAPSNGEKKN